jgi:2-succinyl-5-enolpyruvyl-6-hydroxy-3-cyclohexene-1-carboxylate synthase
MPDNDKNAFQTAWLSARKRMIIVGQHAPDAHLSKLLEQLALQKNTVVLTETTSNMNFPCFTNAIDQVLTQITAEKEHEFFPDVVLTFGGHIVSKKIKAWLRNSTYFQHFNISPDYQAPDTFLHLSKHLRCQTADVLKIAIEGPSAEEDFIRNWQQITMKAKTIHQEFMETIPYSDFRVFRELHASLTTKTQLHFANSTSIRYSQFFDFDRHIIDGNRGVSGIDGSTSTALGQSLHFEGQTILVTGDLSFFYDINALWNNYLHSNFKILLINNSGGGIFRFLDGPLKSGQIDLFETPHNRTAQHLAQDAGMKYLYCREASNLSTKIHELIESSQSTILEVFTPRQVNDVVLNDYFRFLRNSTL